MVFVDASVAENGGERVAVRCFFSLGFQLHQVTCWQGSVAMAHGVPTRCPSNVSGGGESISRGAASVLVGAQEGRLTSSLDQAMIDIVPRCC